jgi:hypothetical protein
VEDTATKNVKTAVRTAEKMADDVTATATTTTPKTTTPKRTTTKTTTPKTATSQGRGYASWTKSDLLDRAQELDIEGRTTMKKNELIKALRAAN